jgi:hypothetical protein
MQFSCQKNMGWKSLSMQVCVSTWRTKGDSRQQGGEIGKLSRLGVGTINKD